jgi:hypothetical protein
VPLPVASAAPSAPATTVAAPEGARPGSHVLHGGRIHIAQQGELVDVHDRTNATVRQRIAGMCDIRDRARKLLAAQLDDVSDNALADLRRGLNGSYDRFVARHGCLTSRANALAFRRDPDYPLLLSLEHYDEEEEAATKADIFHRRTVSRVVEPVRAAEPDEALAHSTQWRGRVDLAYMAELLQADVHAVARDLEDRGLIYRNPETGDHETADAYLSGNVKRKLHAALAAGAAYESNVRALENGDPGRPATRVHRAQARRGVDPGGVGRGLHQGGPEAARRRRAVPGQGRHLVGPGQQVRGPGQRDVLAGVRHRPHERDRTGAVRPQRADADGPRSRIPTATPTSSTSRRRWRRARSWAC